MDEKLFFAKPEEISTYIRQINAWKEGKLKRNDIIIIGKAGIVLKALNVSDFDIVILQKTITKATSPETVLLNGNKGHDLTLGIIKTIPEYLNDPLMVFKSRTQKNSFVILTNAFDRTKRPVIIALHLDKSKGRLLINEIASIYGRNNANDFIESNIKTGNLMYIDKKRSLKWGTKRGLQLSPMVHPSSGYINNVLCKEDIVNGKKLQADSAVKKKVLPFEMQSY